MTLLGNPTRKRGLRRIFLAYASGYQVFKQHQFVLAALGYSLNFSVPDNSSYLKLRRLVCGLQGRLH